MPPSERTPLVASSIYPPQCEPLEDRAAALLRSGVGRSLSANVDLTHELASALYALHVVERHDRARGSARAAAFRASETARTRAALRDHAVAALDAALEYAGGNAGDPEGKDDDDDDVLELSRPLPIKEERNTTVAALLAHHTTPDPVLEHPLIRASLPRAWSRSRRSRREPARSLRGLLDRAVTPARAHVLELVASLVFIALTFVTALVPDIDVRPDTSGATTIVWCVWAWASLLGSMVDAAHRRRGPSSSTHLVLMLPAQLAGVLLPVFPSFAIFLRTLAIPCCTLAVVLPSAPSVPFLLPHRLLPLSIMLAGILARGAKAAALLIPLAAGLWALFAYALNGDVWRAGSINSIASVGGGGPIEVGVAPFETRVALFVTLVLVLALSAALSILRAMAPSNDIHDGTWEAEYGPAIGFASRRALAAAVARYLPPSSDAAPPSPPLPVPLNVFVLPLDILAGFWRLARHEPPFGIRRARGWIALIIVGVPCLLLAPVGAFLPHW